MIIHSIYSLFHVDSLALAVILLVSFIGATVIIFASRFMQGDSRYTRLLTLMAAMVLSVAVMSAADNLILFLCAWACSNILLVVLMTHNWKWRAAFNAGKLAAKTFSLGFVSLACALTLLSLETHTLSIQQMLAHANTNTLLGMLALALIVMTAMTQSAIWPFHRWLLSSLNSPTPVSAIMHAGLVNGGGFLLARFAPLFLSNLSCLNIIFILGLVTACLGTWWKLLQHDVKRMLACSTMGQMGFMLAQCGLGLFAAAIVHLCWHGMFKANLFLSANSAAQEKRIEPQHTVTLRHLLFAICCGMLGGILFSTAMHITLPLYDTRIIIIALAVITGAQFSLGFSIGASWQKLPVIAALTAAMSYLYGYSIYAFESILPANLYHPIALNPIHIFGLIVLIIGWLAILFKKNLVAMESPFINKLYMNSLNASQPHPATTTNNRRDYQYE